MPLEYAQSLYMNGIDDGPKLLAPEVGEIEIADEIAFHESKANPVLVKHFNRLSVAKGSRVFVPLCGKTLDISWLLSNGYRVAGAELSQIAIEQLFIDLGLQPDISTYLLATYLLCRERDLAESMPLLICYDYDQSVMPGPPFSVSNEEVNRHYTGSYDVSLIASTDVPGGLKGKCAAKENVWRLKSK